MPSLRFWAKLGEYAAVAVRVMRDAQSLFVSPQPEFPALRPLGAAEPEVTGAGATSRWLQRPAQPAVATGAAATAAGRRRSGAWTAVGNDCWRRCRRRGAGNGRRRRARCSHGFGLVENRSRTRFSFVATVPFPFVQLQCTVIGLAGQLG